MARSSAERLQGSGKKNADLPVSEAASRRVLRCASGGVTYCLINGIKEGKVKLEDLKKDELPDQLKGKSLTNKGLHKKVTEEREEMTRRVIDLTRSDRVHRQETGGGHELAARQLRPERPASSRPRRRNGIEYVAAGEGEEES
jgi:hypothetical protein